MRHGGAVPPVATNGDLARGLEREGGTRRPVWKRGAEESPNPLRLLGSQTRLTRHHQQQARSPLALDAKDTSTKHYLRSSSGSSPPIACSPSRLAHAATAKRFGNLRKQPDRQPQPLCLCGFSTAFPTPKRQQPRDLTRDSGDRRLSARAGFLPAHGPRLDGTLGERYDGGPVTERAATRDGSFLGHR